MQLHDLKSKTARKSQKRVGRGGKRGTYSGRGIKGQKARAGHRIRPALRDLLKKIPKRRGYRFSPITKAGTVLTVSAISKHFLPNAVVSPEILAKRGLIGRTYRAKGAVKILGDGMITKSLIIKNIPTSRSARAKIEAAGGKIME